MFKSPKIKISENDLSSYKIVRSEYGIAIVGFATKGPIGIPIEVSSRDEFRKTFGGCSEKDTATYQAVISYLRQTDRVTFIRVADSDTVKESVGYVLTEAVEESPAKLLMVATSLEKGTANDKLKLIFRKEVSPLNELVTVFLDIYYGKELVETFSGVESSDLLSKINAAPENGGSKYVRLENKDLEDQELEVATDGDYPAFNKEVILSGGNDGIPEENDGELFVEVLDIDGILSDRDNLDFHLLTIPSCAGLTNVQDAAINLAEDREDCLFLIDPPLAKNVNEVIDWHNGKEDGNGRQTAFDSSYAAIYYSWQKDKNFETNQYEFFPPSIFVGENILHSCKNGKPWLAVAGKKRGRINSIDAEIYPNEKQRDKLYGGVNCINPISYFKGEGAIIWGQKTTQRKNTKLDRVNVRMMLIVLKKRLKNALDDLMFDPNNPSSWATARLSCESILQPFAVGDQAGLDSYSVRFDSILNTPEVQQNNILKGQITIVPYGTIEGIDLGINITPVGTSIVEL